MSSITVVEELMRRVQKDQNLLELPLPGKHFKLIVGAGFSGQVHIVLLLVLVLTPNSIVY
jgi:hypothetical protein